MERFRTVLTINAVVLALYVILLFFIPHLYWPLTGVEITPDLLWLSRLFAVLVAGYALLSWFMRQPEHSHFARAFSGTAVFLWAGAGLLELAWGLAMNRWAAAALVNIALGMLFALLFLPFVRSGANEMGKRMA